MRVRKALFMAVLALITAGSLHFEYYFNSKILAKINRDIFFTRIAVESRIYTRQIEYELDSGKSLENFYNMDNTLKGVKKCSFYIRGAYIVSNEYKILYYTTDDDEAPLDRVAVFSSEQNNLYSYLFDSENERYILSLPIYENGNFLSGLMVFSIDSSFTVNMLENMQTENFYTSICAAALFIMAGIALIIRQKKKYRFWRDMILIITVILCSTLLVNGGLMIVRYYINENDAITQSVSKIVITLQSTLQEVVDSGVSLDKIYDLNTWLVSFCRQIPYIDSVNYDNHYNISAVMSSNYIQVQGIGLYVSLASALALCAVAGTAAWLPAWYADRRCTGKEKRSKKRIDDTR